LALVLVIFINEPLMDVTGHAGHLPKEPIELILLEVTLSKMKLEVNLLKPHHLIAFLRLLGPVVVLGGRVMRATFHNHVDLLGLG
jgi:hypothetical protein